MNILMIAQRLPYPPDKGEKIRSFHELRYLADRHDVWCACLIDDPADVEHVEPLRQWCRELAAFRVRRWRALGRAGLNLLAGGTMTEGYFRSRRLASVIAHWSDRVQFDAVLAFSSSIARYGLTVPARRRVVDLCDVDSQKWAAYAERKRVPAQWLLTTEARRLARREWYLAAAYDAATVISDQEAALFEQAGESIGADAPGAERARVSVFGNGIDLEAFHPPETPPTESIVGFVGTMNYPPNVEAVEWFADRVWPAIRHALPDARFMIVGRSPSRRVHALAAVPGVEVTGTVLDVLPYLHKMQVCVAPLQMVHGLANKVLQAMACATPVVATSAVARAVGATPGRDIVAVDEPQAFGTQVLALLEDQDGAARLGAAARQFVEVHCQWDHQLAKLEQLLTGP
jgi:sugar transferase (PEP-CTERM/EpsH1 system associated)